MNDERCFFKWHVFWQTSTAAGNVTETDSECAENLKLKLDGIIRDESDVSESELFFK